MCIYYIISTYIHVFNAILFTNNKYRYKIKKEWKM